MLFNFCINLDGNTSDAREKLIEYAFIVLLFPFSVYWRKISRSDEMHEDGSFGL